MCTTFNVIALDEPVGQLCIDGSGNITSDDIAISGNYTERTASDLILAVYTNLQANSNYEGLPENFNIVVNGEDYCDNGMSLNNIISPSTPCDIKIKGKCDTYFVQFLHWESSEVIASGYCTLRLSDTFADIKNKIGIEQSGISLDNYTYTHTRRDIPDEKMLWFFKNGKNFNFKAIPN